MAKITLSYAGPSGLPEPLFGAGHGKVDTVSRAADRCTSRLVRHIGQDVAVRCNNEGEDGGAFRNGQKIQYAPGVIRQPKG